MSQTISILRQSEIFEALPESQLDWLVQNSELREYAKGDVFFDVGDPMNHMHILLKGRLAIRIPQDGQFRQFGEISAIAITGVLPYSRAIKTTGMGVILEDTQVLSLPKTLFPELIQNHYELTEKLVHTLTSRVREFTKTQQLNEKMVALGKISAGLAHELNNPSAAVVRTARELKKHLGAVPDKFKKVVKVELKDEQIDAVNDLLFERLEAGAVNLSMMDRQDKEDELIDWMDEREIDESMELAEVLVEYNFSVDDLEMILEQVGEGELGAVLNWFENVLTTEKMVAEIEEASKRISDLVTSIKGYTHMDQSPEKQLTDAHVGIRNTLKILNHKIKKKNINYSELFDTNLPEVSICISEMNQVWTNLIDNAIDAMEEGGKLEIASIHDGDFVKFYVRDSGSGIPEEIQDKIFDPFFTTKKVGEGTGIGLDIVQKIVLDHNGNIKVNSEPGRTEFEVCLPIGN